MSELRECPEVSAGCKCQGCGEIYKVDVVIPNDLWERIKPEGKPEGAGLLCGTCIFKAIEEVGEFGALHLVDRPTESKLQQRVRELEEWYREARQMLRDVHHECEQGRILTLGMGHKIAALARKGE
jgi:hypothetical protein